MLNIGGDRWQKRVSHGKTKGSVVQIQSDNVGTLQDGAFYEAEQSWSVPEDSKISNVYCREAFSGYDDWPAIGSSIVWVLSWGESANSTERPSGPAGVGMTLSRKPAAMKERGITGGFGARNSE